MELIKPLGGADWGTVDAYLRDVQLVVARAANAAMRALAVNVDDPADVHAQTLARGRIVAAIEAERAAAAAALERPNTRKEIRAKLARIAELKIGSYVIDGVCAVVYSRWSTDRKALFTCDISLPSFKRNIAIPIRDRGWKLTRDDRGYVLELRPTGGRGGAAAVMRFAVSCGGDGALAVLRRIVTGEYGAGDCKIKFDDRRGKWVARLAYSFPAPPSALDPSRAVAIHLGARTFLNWADSDGRTGVVDVGGDVIAFKGQMLRRRRAMQSKIRSAGKGSRGHGRARLYRGYSVLDDTEARWVDTKCKQVAAVVARLAVDSNSGRILIEDWSPRELAAAAGADGREHTARFIRRFPFYKLRGTIEWAARRAGVVVEYIESHYNATTCPRCGNVDPEQNNGRGGFACANARCGLRRSADGVAAWNLHRRGTGSGVAFDEHARHLDTFRANLTGVGADTGFAGSDGYGSEENAAETSAAAADDTMG